MSLIIIDKFVFSFAINDKAIFGELEPKEDNEKMKGNCNAGKREAIQSPTTSLLADASSPQTSRKTML